MSDIYDPNEPSDWWQRADAAKQVERETETLNDQIDRLTRERDELREALRLWQLADENSDAEDWESAYKAAQQKRDVALANLNKTDPET